MFFDKVVVGDVVLSSLGGGGRDITVKYHGNRSAGIYNKDGGGGWLRLSRSRLLDPFFFLRHAWNIVD